MFKKAGIIVSLCVVVIAIIIYIVVGKGYDEGSSEHGAVELHIENRPPVHVERKDNIFTLVDYNTLPPLEKTETRNMIVQDKQMFLFDSNVGTVEGKQLYYTLILYSEGEEKLNLFVAKNIFDSVSVGDVLVVGFSVHKNEWGVRFTVINSVSKGSN